MCSGKANGASAVVAQDTVVARSAVLAWTRRALVNGLFTMLAKETINTFAQVGVDTVDTGAAVEANVWQAVVEVGLTDVAGETKVTLTCVISHLVDTRGTVKARLRGTHSHNHLRLTQHAGRKGRAHTLVRGEKLAQDAVGAVLAW
jgi:hypothetical protein